MQKVMLSLARRAAEAFLRPLHEARDLSQQYDVRLRAKDITAYQQSLADTLQFDEDEAQVDMNSSVAFSSFLNKFYQFYTAKEAATSPTDSYFSLWYGVLLPCR